MLLADSDFEQDYIAKNNFRTTTAQILFNECFSANFGTPDFFFKNYPKLFIERRKRDVDFSIFWFH